VQAINSSSLQEAVAGVSGEESLFAVKKPAIKWLFGTKCKRSSKKGRRQTRQPPFLKYYVSSFGGGAYSTTLS